MTKQALFHAINTMAQELNLNHWIQVDNEVFAPMAMSSLAAVAWVKNQKSTDSSVIVKEQLNNLWGGHGALKFDDTVVDFPVAISAD